MPAIRPDINLPATVTLPSVVTKMQQFRQPKGQQFHGRPDPVAYVSGCGRADVAGCEHPQFLDKDLGVTAWCLDCGAEFYVGLASPDGVPWKTKPGGEVLSNADLNHARHAFHAIWGIGPYQGRVQGARLGEYINPPGALQPSI